MGKMGQWTADGLISISSPVTTVGDWDGIRAGDPDDIDVNGRLVIEAAAAITVGGNMPNGLWADGGGGIGWVHDPLFESTPTPPSSSQSRSAAQQ